jgi:hypothetical protein
MELRAVIAMGQETKTRYDEIRAADTIYTTLRDQVDAARQKLAMLDTDGDIADAPFRTTWPLQLFKRQLRDAVEGGFDAVSWDVGETQNDRFDLSKSIDSIEVDARDNTVHDVRVFEKSGSVIDLEVDGGTVKYGQFAGKRLDEVIGKDMADKILSVSNETSSEFSGDGLKMGGSGMRGFYDTILPKEIGKYVEKWNGKVEKSEIKGNAADIDTRAENIFAEWERTGNDYNKTYSDAQEQAYAELGKNGVVESTPIWRVDITPEMRKISETGQTRYLPEGKYDRETAIKNKDVLAKRFENFKPQVGFDKLETGWQRPSDGKFVDTGEHHNFYKEDGGNQLGDPIEIGYVRIVREGKTLYYEGKPNPKQLRELKDTSIELGLTLVRDNDTTRYLPEGKPKATKTEFSNPRRSDKKYNNPALARSISLAISGASTNKEK